MASNIPEQIRAVDPFASYNSDTVNQLTRMVTNGSNALKNYPELNVIEDSTSPTTSVIVTPGAVYMDDVLISITENHIVDFTDPQSYVSFTTGFDEDGWYSIVMEYNYVKSRPAPPARIKILKPSQWNHSSLGISLHFLKAIKVTGGGPHYIDISTSFKDYDPNHTDNKREYVDLYFGVETFLPTFNALTDIGRVVYESYTNTFWFGYDNRWAKLNESVEVSIDTTGLEVGDLCYVDSSGNATGAIATSINTGAELVVLAIGGISDNSGRALLLGYAADIPVETGITILIGDLLYLSSTEATKITNEKPSSYPQVVGKALTTGDDSTPINILFTPKSVQPKVSATTTAWLLDGGSGEYYYDIDVTGLLLEDETMVVSAKNTADDLVISPADIDFSIADTVRIWMPDNTVTLLVTILG